MAYIAVALALLLGFAVGVVLTGFGFYTLLDEEASFQQAVIDRLKEKEVLQ